MALAGYNRRMRDLRSKNWRHNWTKPLLFLCTTGALLILFLVRWWASDSKPTETNVLTYVVSRGAFHHVVVEQGEVESSRNVEIRCEVKTRNSQGITILEVVDEGTRVKRGDILLKLDSSALDRELVQQQIVCNTSQALMVQAQNSFEAAKIALKEYVEGTFYQEEQKLQSNVFIAEENVRRSQEYAKYSKHLAARGYVTGQQLEGDQFAVEKAKTELTSAKTELRVLQEYTKEKTLKQLESDIKTAEAQWKSELSSHQLELAKLQEFEQQIEKCVIRAPESGQVIHANEYSRRGNSEFVVEPGTLVREQQVLIRLPDPEHMQVKAKINESRVTAVKNGMTANIHLDALGNRSFSGLVTRVNEYPEPGSWFSSQIKQYATFVEIINPPEKIRPGLTAEVIIDIDFREDVLTVPVQAIYGHGELFYCFVSHESDWQPVEIEVGASNDRFAVVLSGLEEGITIAMHPRTVVDVRKFTKASVKLAGNTGSDGDTP